MRILYWSALLLSVAAQASPWEFDAPVPVTESAQNTFVHLESSGRKSIALSAGWVAVTWEDNRDGVPRCYVAFKRPGNKSFEAAIQVSGKEEAAEPTITGMEKGRFALAWEEAGHIRVRTLSAHAMGTPYSPSGNAAQQASLGFDPHAGLFAVWSEKGSRYWMIRLAGLKADANGRLRGVSNTLVDASAAGDQSYPSIALLPGKKVVVAWEDRRDGHTRMLYAVSQNGAAKFAPPLGLNEYKVRDSKQSAYGGGTGAMRVALARQGHGDVAAVWADKRDFQSGYDIYAAFAHSPKLVFGANEKVQDEFGNNFSQWHPAIASNESGRIAVAWDDDRDGTPDVWLTWRNADGWYGDLAVPGASGSGVQSDPSIALDDAGNLHLVWVEKADLNSPSHLRYAYARASGK